MYEAIILAGGFGTRLREAVPDLPKPMAPVADKPFLAWLIEFLIQSGVSRFILSVGYKAETIQSYFGGEYHGAEIVYALEQSPLGTGGAIKYALEQATQERVFVLNGDSICDINLKYLRNLSECRSGMVGIAVKHVDNAGRYGAITFNEHSNIVTSFGEKTSSSPGFINAGVYDVPRNIFSEQYVNPPFSFESAILHQFVGERLLACPTGDFFIDIGIPDDFRSAQVKIPAFFRRFSNHH